MRNLPLFSSLTEEELNEIRGAIQHRTYAAGNLILRAGDAADALYYVMSGRVHVLREDGHGREIITAVWGPKEFFGESGLFEGGPRLENARAHEPCEVLHVPRKPVLECLQRNPAAALFMVHALAERLANAHNKIGSLALLDVYARVARVLLDSGRDERGEWLVECGSELIAAMVGASREMVSRVIKDMIAKGNVRRRKRKLIVLDRAALLARSAGSPHSSGGNGSARVPSSNFPAAHPTN